MAHRWAPRHVDVIIVGAGIGGCAAAKVLQEQEVEILLIESKGRAGGSTMTRKYPTGGLVELGAGHIAPSQDKIIRLATDMGLETVPVDNNGKNVVLGNKGKKTFFKKSLPGFKSPIIWFDINNLFRKLDKLQDKIPPEAPWSAKDAEKWDKLNMEQWLKSVAWTKEAYQIGRSFVVTMTSAEPCEVSMLWFLWYMKSCNGSRQYWACLDQLRRVQGGLNQLTQKLSDALASRCLLDSPVTVISDYPRANSVTVTTLNGSKYFAKYVIVTVPPPLYPSITFEPPLPPLKRQLAQRAFLGSYIKTQARYKNAFWKQKGLSGFSVIGDQNEPLISSMDDTDQDGNHPALVGIIAGDQARKLMNSSIDERRELVCKCYAKIFGTDEALEPLEYVDHDWTSEPYSDGGRAMVLPPGILTCYGTELSRAHGNVYFGGSEVGSRWMNHMDGAVGEGERAAREVLHALGKITEEEVFQTEPESTIMPHANLKLGLWRRLAPSVGGILKLATTATVVAGASALAYLCQEQIQEQIQEAMTVPH